VGGALCSRKGAAVKPPQPSTSFLLTGALHDIERSTKQQECAGILSTCSICGLQSANHSQSMQFDLSLRRLGAGTYAI